MTNELKFIPIQGGHTIRAMHDGAQLATAEEIGGYWMAQTHPNGTRYFAITARQAIMLALGIREQANFESGDYIATQYTNGMISYRDKVKNE